MRTVSRRIVPFAAAAAIVALLLQGGVSQAQTVAAKPTLKQMVAEATKLSNEVDELGQQYDELKIQLAQAKSQVKTAKQAEQRAQQAMAGSETAVAQLAAMGYMSDGMSSTLQMLTSSDPSELLSQASTVQQLDNEAGMRVSTLLSEQTAAKRAQVTAKEEIATSDKIQAEINGKVTTIQSKLDVLNSSAMAQALAVFDQTGSYPNIVLPEASTVGTVALRAAMTRIGDPYVWGAAGPDEFDCSGLIVWAFAQEGISLPHYTGSLWDEGEHISESDLEPGDLVFFYSNISHVGIYIGNGLMVDAPSAGQDVMIQPISADPYVGAVRIA